MSKVLLLLSIPTVGTAFWASRAAAEGLPSPTTLIIPLIVILILVLLNGLFVASEFSIIGVRSTQMEQMSNEGDKTAGKILDTVESRRKQDRWIATAQLGITIASLGLAMYGEPAIGHFVEPYLEEIFGISAELGRTIGYIIALSIMTYLHVVLGEMVPKALALFNPSGTVLRLWKPMGVSQTILHYPVLVLNGIGTLLLRLFRVPPAEGHARLLTPDELEMVIAESTEGGLLQAEEEDLIRNIFDFSDRTVGQVMTPRPKVQAIPINVSRDNLLKLVTESSHSRFPVYEGDLDHIVGILHLKDLVRQSIKRKGSFDLRLILRAAPAVPEDQQVEQLLAAFKRQKLHMAVVLDEFGGMAGIVTLEDLVEEVVGEVTDEFDNEFAPYVEVEPGHIEVAGDYLVDDLQEHVYLGSDEDLPDVETVGGLIVSKLGAPPKVGDVVLYNKDQVTMTVLNIDRRAVARARVEFLALEETEEDSAEDAEEH